MDCLGKLIKTEVGIHGSSAALLLYLRAQKTFSPPVHQNLDCFAQPLLSRDLNRSGHTK